MTLLTLNKSIQLHPYVPPQARPVELMSDEELWNGAGGTLILDTESYNNYFLIAFKCTKTGKYVQMEAPFNAQKLSWTMHAYQTVGFNSINYDLPMVWAAYLNQDTKRLQEISWRLVQGTFIKEVQKEFDFQIFKTRHIDLIEVCPLKGSLKLYGARIHSPRIQDLPFNVNISLEEHQKQIVKDYNINDLDETERLLVFLKDRLDLRTNMTIQYNTDLMSHSDAQIAEAVINREVRKIVGQWPKKSIIEYGTEYKYNVPSYLQYTTPVLKKTLSTVANATFKIGHNGVDLPKEINGLVVPLSKANYRMGVGGLHSYEKCVAYRSTNSLSIIDRDVASYYPQIILNQRLYPDSMGEAFLQVYQSLKDRRLEAKRAKRTTEDKGLKVTINGTFGKSNSIWSTLYSPQMFIQVVMTGQLSLLMLIEMIEAVGIEVISANTDGIVMLCPQHLEADCNATITEWEQRTSFTTEETRYSAYFARDVNAYFAVKSNGEVKVKGPYSEVGSATGTQLDNNPASLICSDAVKALLSNGKSIEQTINECQDIRRFVTVRNVKSGAHKDGFYLGKTVRFYYRKGERGTINYILSGNKVPDTDGAWPCMDLPTSFPVDLNHDWYIAKAREILYDIGYLQKPKQVEFF